MLRYSGLFLFVILSLFACESESTPDGTSLNSDAGSPVDSGSSQIDSGTSDSEASTPTESVDLIVGGSKQSWDCPATVKKTSANSGDYLLVTFGPCAGEKKLLVNLAIKTGEQTCSSDQSMILWSEDGGATFYNSYEKLDGGTSGKCQIDVKDIGTTSGFVEATISSGTLVNPSVSPTSDSGFRNIEGTFRVRMK